MTTKVAVRKDRIRRSSLWAAYGDALGDDTQLRLATGRAIRPDSFDVEAFAKVGLPVWLGCALGAGKSTSAAALNLSKPRTSWFANTFKGWTESGGNGAAMRIQPHVWAARSRMPDQTVSQPVPETASGSRPLDLQSAVNYVTEHRDDDGKIGKALRKVVTEGTPDEVAGFTGALVALIRQPK